MSDSGRPRSGCGRVNVPEHCAGDESAASA